MDLSFLRRQPKTPARRLARLRRTVHRFADRLSHEFRTPLTVIKEFTTLLEEELVGPISPKQRELLAVVHDRADDLAILVDAMLDANKSDARLLSAWRRDVSLAEILEPIQGMLRRKAAVKKVNFEVAFPDGLPAVYCDPDHIGRVMVSLAVRAIRASGEGGAVQLWARANPLESEVVLGVTDNGPAIPRQKLDRIFGRSPLAGRSYQSAKGFGLGLSIARELAALNLATISVTSTPGKGSTFAVSVPEANPSALAVRYLHQLEQSAPDAQITLLTAEVPGPIAPGLSTFLDEFLHQSFRGLNLVLRVQPHEWLILAQGDDEHLGRLLDRARHDWAEVTQRRRAVELPTLRYAIQSAGPLSTNARPLLGCFDTLLAGPFPVGLSS